MARIRTIKPDFFTSADIVALSPLTRLLYIATWCEADKEGRLVWRPMTFKLRYLPGDECNIDALCAELTSAGLVVLYGDGYAWIPGFARHQHLNPRESASVLPDPHETKTKPKRVGDASQRVDDASARVPHAQGGREGKGMYYVEPNGSPFAGVLQKAAPQPPAPPPDFDGNNATALNGKTLARIAQGFELPAEWGIDAEALGYKPDEVLREAEKFRQYWTAGKGTGKRRTVRGWRQTWSNWLEKASRDHR